jgi:hypothetical protein
MEHYKTFLPFMEQEVRIQCCFDDKGRVKKTEANELDEEAKEEATEEAKEEKRALEAASLPGSRACWRS